MESAAGHDHGHSGIAGSGSPAADFWWQHRAWLLAFAVMAVIPLLYPPIPPLVDLPGHMGRYRIELDVGHSATLARYYGFHWAAIGNLGVDLLVWPLGRLVGLEPAVKLIVVAIPPLTVAGFLWVAYEVHHRIPPTALFALPFVYSHPLMFGFVNFALSVALAFLAFGLWLQLARIGRLKLRAILFVPISLIVFFTHAFGWGMLGLLCFSAEAVRQRDLGRNWIRSANNAALQAAVMSIPAFITIAWRSDAHGGMTRNWFDWDFKLLWLKAVLRDRWQWYDIGSASLIGLLIAAAIFSRRLTFSRNLLFTAFVLLAFFIILPRTVFGSTYADMRLLPYVMAVIVLAIRFRGEIDRRLANVLAILGLLFCVVRLGGNTISLAMASNDQQPMLAALDHVPAGARVVSLVGTGCASPWALPRNSHLGGMAIVRREGFSNDQWVIEGANLLSLRYRAGKFSADPSQIVRANDCVSRTRRTIDDALRAIPRHRFDYLWLIDPPPYDPALVAGMRPVWRGPGSILYQVSQ